MERHFTLTDEEFEKQFREGLLNAALFTHEAHLRLAWIHIRKYGVAAAIENIPCQLQRFVTALGARHKYNETVTIAAIKAVSHFMRKSGADNFTDFIAGNPRLKYNFTDLLACHYQTDIFNAPAAKEKYLAPELLPFD